MKLRRFFTHGGLFALLGVLFVTSGCKASDVEPNPIMPALKCELQLQKSYPQGGEVLVNFSLSNHSESEFEVLQYHTPLEDLIGPVFEVRFGDELLSYRGPMVKRAPPTDEDWLRLLPGAVLSNELDISRAWDLTRKGQYSLSLSQDVSYRKTGSTEVLNLPVAACPTMLFAID